MPQRKTEEDRELVGRICGWIRHEMEVRELSQNEIARLMGLQSGTLSRYMSGEQVPGCGFVLKAARALKEVTTSKLVHDNPEPRFMAQQEPSPPSRQASAPPARAQKPRERSEGGRHGR